MFKFPLLFICCIAVTALLFQCEAFTMSAPSMRMMGRKSLLAPKIPLFGEKAISTTKQFVGSLSSFSALKAFNAPDGPNVHLDYPSVSALYNPH